MYFLKILYFTIVSYVTYVYKSNYRSLAMQNIRTIVFFVIHEPANLLTTLVLSNIVVQIVHALLNRTACEIVKERGEITVFRDTYK